MGWKIWLVSSVLVTGFYLLSILVTWVAWWIHIMFIIIIILMWRATVRSFQASRAPKDNLDVTDQS